MEPTSRNSWRGRLHVLPLVAVCLLSSSSPSVADARRMRQEVESAPPRAETVRRPNRFKRTMRKVLDFLHCTTAERRKATELSEGGPEFPETYDPSHFSVAALLQGGWPVVVVYKLEGQATANITFRVMGARPHVETLQGAGMSVPGVASFKLPSEFGPRPLAGLITFEAFVESGGVRRRAEFRLEALGLGNRAVESAFFVRPEISQGEPLFVNASYRARAAVGPGDVVIYDVTLSRGSGGAFAFYGFSTRNIFGNWGAEFLQDVPRRGPAGGTVYVTRSVIEQRFRQRIFPRMSPIRRDWDGTDFGGRRAGGGQYRVRIKAWWSAVEGGESAVRELSSLVPLNW